MNNLNENLYNNISMFDDDFLESKIQNTINKIKNSSKIEHREKLKLDDLQHQLDIGNNVFSYKQLCSILGDDLTKGGKRRQEQLIFWQYFIDMYLVGYKWHINKIYDIPLMSFYTDEKSKFYQFNMYIIISLLLRKKEMFGQKFLFFSMNELASILGYFNANFLNYLYSFSKGFNVNSHLSKFNKIPNNILTYFFKNTWRSYSYIIKSSLDKMERFHMIYYQKVVIGRDTLNGNLRCLSSFEIQQYADIGQEAFEKLKELKKKENYPHDISVNLVFCNSKLYREYLDVKNDLTKEKLHLSYIRTVFQIFFNSDFLSKIKNEFIEEINSIPLEQRIIELNLEFMKKRSNCFNIHYDKEMKKENEQVYNKLLKENEGWGTPNLMKKENFEKFYLANFKDVNMKSFSDLVDEFLEIDASFIMSNIEQAFNSSDNIITNINDFSDVINDM